MCVYKHLCICKFMYPSADTWRPEEHIRYLTLPIPSFYWDIIFSLNLKLTILARPGSSRKLGPIGFPRLQCWSWRHMLLWTAFAGLLGIWTYILVFTGSAFTHWVISLALPYVLLFFLSCPWWDASQLLQQSIDKGWLWGQRGSYEVCVFGKWQKPSNLKTVLYFVLGILYK